MNNSITEEKQVVKSVVLGLNSAGLVATQLLDVGREKILFIEDKDEKESRNLNRIIRDYKPLIEYYELNEIPDKEMDNNHKLWKEIIDHLVKVGNSISEEVELVLNKKSQLPRSHRQFLCDIFKDKYNK